MNWADREEVLDRVSKEGMNLLHASVELRGDKEIVLAAVRQNGCAIECASSQLKDDEEVVLEAILGDSAAIKHASDRVRSLCCGFGCPVAEKLKEVIFAEKAVGQKERINLVVEKDRLLTKLGKGLPVSRNDISSCPAVVLEDEDLVTELLQKNKGLLRAFPESVRSNKNLVEIAVKEDYASFEGASDSLRRDEHLVMVFFSEWAWGMGRDSVSPVAPWEISLKKHGVSRSFYKEVEGLYLESFYLYYPDDLRDSKEEALEAVKLDAEVFGRMSHEFRGDKDIALAAVSKYGWLLKHVSNGLNTDAEVVLTALETTYDAVSYVGWPLAGELRGQYGAEVFAILKTRVEECKAKRQCGEISSRLHENICPRVKGGRKV